MPLDFPTNPTLNDTYSFGNRTWTWNGSAWQLNTTSAGAINGIPVGNVAPSTGAFTELSVTGNILTDNYRYANGDPFSGGGGASNVVVGTRPTPVYVALATSTTLDIVARTGNVTLTLTT